MITTRLEIKRSEFIKSYVTWVELLIKGNIIKSEKNSNTATTATEVVVVVVVVAVVII